jgi:heptosyltransferase-2
VNKLPQKILIRGVNWIGDAVLTVPAIKAVRRAFPDAHISLLVKPWVAEIFSGNPDVDEIIPYDAKFNGIAGKFRLTKVLRESRFDTAILLQNAFDAALITWLARIPERIGYKRDFRGLLLTNAIPVPEDILDQHQVNYYLNIVKSVQDNIEDTPPYIYLSDSERQRASETIASGLQDPDLPLIGINPGATYGSAKRWPPEYFATLIMKIINVLNGRIIIFGSPSEIEIANEIINEINKLKIKLKIEYASRIMVMSGKTNLRELAALISECDVFITNDSGPMHMAAALHVPTAAIFGSTDPVATGPFGKGHRVVTRDLACSPCLERECPEGDLKCMSEITPDDVFSALQEILPRNRAVFLDKDGTIIEDKNYLNSFDDLVIYPLSRKNLQQLKKAGFKLIGITNQSGIARGVVDERFVIESNEHLQNKLGIDGFYYCPHHPDDKCACRKPEPLMALTARLEHGIDLKMSYVIGDKESDVLLGKKTGATGILITSTPLFANTSAAFIAKDLKEAVGWILERET